MTEPIIAMMISIRANSLNHREKPSRHRPVSIFIRHEFITISTQRRTIFAHFARENVTKKKKGKPGRYCAQSRENTQEEKHVETPRLRKRFENERSAARGGIFRAVARHYRPLSPSGATVDGRLPPPPTVFLLITSPLVRRFFEKPRETIR